MIFSLVLGAVLLVGGAELLVRGGGRLALLLRVPALVVGLTVVAFGTSSPELSVSVSAAMGGQTDIALANVIGSNIANIALVLGLAALVRPIPLQSRLVSRELMVCIALQAVVLLMCLDGALTRLNGLLLVGAGVTYQSWLVVHTIRGRRRAEHTPRKSRDWRTVAWQLTLVLAGAAALVWGAERLVSGAVELAIYLGWSPRMVGLTVVALGTSAPEVATAVVSSWRREAGLAVGSSLGSNILNIVLVLGVTAAIAPIPFRGGPEIADQVVAIAVLVILVPLGLAFARIGRPAGALLATGYVVYLVSTTW